MLDFRNKTIFFFFEILLLIFFWRTIEFWSIWSDYGYQQKDVLLYLSMGMMEVMVIVMLSPKVRFGGSRSGIHPICIYWFILMVGVVLFNGNTLSQILRAVFFPLFFGMVYYFMEENKKNLRRIYFFSIAVCLMGLVYFLSSITFKGFGKQTNVIYFFVLAVPILLTSEKKAFVNIVLIVTTFMALLSLKRSMMLALALFWFFVAMRSMLISGKIIQLFFVSIFIAAFGLFSFNYIDRLSGNYLTARFEMEDMSNGREDIYDRVWARQKKSTVAHWLIGHGHNAVNTQSMGRQISAHNEWLEILYDYGAVMLILYFSLWVYLIRRWIFHTRTGSKYYLGYTLSICVFGVMSMVTQNILYCSYYLYLVLFWAYVEVLTKKDYLNYRIERKHRTYYKGIHTSLMVKN